MGGGIAHYGRRSKKSPKLERKQFSTYGPRGTTHPRPRTHQTPTRKGPDDPSTLLYPISFVFTVLFGNFLDPLNHWNHINNFLEQSWIWCSNVQLTGHPNLYTKFYRLLLNVDKKNFADVTLVVDYTNSLLAHDANTAAMSSNMTMQVAPVYNFVTNPITLN